jgi:hypothetical protein
LPALPKLGAVIVKDCLASVVAEKVTVPLCAPICVSVTPTRFYCLT